MTTEESKQIERIKGSEEFKGAEKQRDLLDFFAKRMGTPFGAADIEEHFYGCPAFHRDHKPGRSRVAVLELRDRLARYRQANADDKWLCRIAGEGQKEAYELQLISSEQRPASDVFWGAHLDKVSDVIAVCGDHLFFFDRRQKMAFRFYDLNADGTDEELRTALGHFNLRGDRSELLPLRNVYLATGEVQAFEMLQAWFHDRSGILIRRVASRDIRPEMVHRSSPILFGRPDTNRYMKGIFDSQEAKHLGYRMGKTYGSIEIRNVTPQEKEDLAPWGLEVTGKDGKLGPVKNWEHVFGVVTRIPNPSGYGFVTMISFHYYAKVTSQIVEALTTDKLAAAVLAKMKWSVQRNLPGSFELLFAVRISPGNIEGEGVAELLGWRVR